MNNTNLMEACNYYFNELNIYPTKFRYNEKVNLFISEPFQFEEVPDEEFFLMVKPVGNIGIIYVAQEERINKLNIVEQLGMVSYIQNKWV